MASLDLADPATLGRLGAAPDSVDKFIALVGATGLTAHAGVIDPNRTSDQLASTDRFDWNVGDIHTLTVTGNLRLNTQDPTRIGQTQLPQVGGNSHGNSGSLSAQLVSRFGQFINQFRGGYSINDSRSAPFLYVPVGRVTNYSTLDSGPGGGHDVRIRRQCRPAAAEHHVTTGKSPTSSPSFRGMRRTGSPWACMAMAKTSRRTRPATGTARTPTTRWRTSPPIHRRSSPARCSPRSAPAASSTKRSISATPGGRGATGQPPVVAATAAAGDGGGSAAGSAAGAASAARGGFGGGFGGRGGGFGFGGSGGSNFQLIYGVRLEHSSYTGAPALNQQVLDEFGVRTDRLPTQTAITPRVGFTYSIPAPEQQGASQRGFAPPLLTIRGGAGIFRGTMPATLPGTAQAESGLSNTESRAVLRRQCRAAPRLVRIPRRSVDDPERVRRQRLHAGHHRRARRSPATIRRYGAPETERLSLGLSRRITPRVQFTVDASYVRGIDQAASRDLNLNESPQFHLGGGDNRPVYADPTQIVDSTGAVPLSASRIDPDYGTVSRVFSSLENETRQFTFNLSGTTNNQIQLNLAYTLMFARDEGGSGVVGVSAAAVSAAVATSPPAIPTSTPGRRRPTSGATTSRRRSRGRSRRPSS